MKKIEIVDSGIHHLYIRIKKTKGRDYERVDFPASFSLLLEVLSKKFPNREPESLPVHEINPYVTFKHSLGMLQKRMMVFKRSYVSHYAPLKRNDQQTAYTHDPKKKKVPSMLRIYDPLKKDDLYIDSQYAGFDPGELCKVEMRFFPRKTKVSDLADVTFPSFHQPNRWEVFKVIFPKRKNKKNIEKYQILTPVRHSMSREFSIGKLRAKLEKKSNSGNFVRDYKDVLIPDKRVEKLFHDADEQVLMAWNKWLKA